MSTTTSPATFDDIDACDHYYSAATVRLVVGLIEVLCASCGAVTGTLPATMTLAEADEYAGLSQDIGFAWESYGETVAQYRGECAHYGDAWPGAAIEVANTRQAIERSEARLFHLASVHGLLAVHGPVLVPLYGADDEPF